MKFIPDSLSRAVAMQVLKTQEHSPTLLFGAGVVGVIGTVVLASRATLRLEDVLKETDVKLEEVNSLNHARYSERDRTHDKAIVYTEAVIKITKLYGPALLLGTASVAALAGSHRILTKRNAALSAAYAGLEKAFNQYRARVVDELGEEKDREFRYGTQEIEVTDKKGNKVKKKVAGDGSDPGLYARLYDQTNPNWQGLPELDRVFLECQQRYANQRLRAQGYLFLNDAYESLGLSRTTAGQLVGWIWGSEEGDNQVDFGFGSWPNAHDYIHARDFGVWLDFNVDGEIHKKIEDI